MADIVKFIYVINFFLSIFLFGTNLEGDFFFLSFSSFLSFNLYPVLSLFSAMFLINFILQRVLYVLKILIAQKVCAGLVLNRGVLTAGVYVIKLCHRFYSKPKKVPYWNNPWVVIYSYCVRILFSCFLVLWAL